MLTRHSLWLAILRTVMVGLSRFDNSRDRQSHAIALSLRAPLQEIARKYNGNPKIVEILLGPPVMSPLVAEVYGLDYEGQIAMAQQVRAAFEGTADILDVDDSVGHPSPKRLVVDRANVLPCLAVGQRCLPLMNLSFESTGWDTKIARRIFSGAFVPISV